MGITKEEIKRGGAIIILAIGYSLVNEPIERWLINIFPFSPVIIGLIILFIGAYLFQIK